MAVDQDVSQKTQDSIFETIEQIAQNRIDQMRTDKTITATIVKCNNTLTGEYSVSYQGGTFFAYTQDGAAYSKNANVYVLVPEGDFSKKKLIIGRASAYEDDNNITFVSSLINDYNTVGRNTIDSSKGPFGLHSYYAQDFIQLYKFRGKDNLVNINEDEFYRYVQEAEALMIEASFRTNLPNSHRVAKDGMYGLQFLLAFENRDGEEEYRTYSYVLDANGMTGNPFAYLTWSDQYMIFPIDVENFSHIEAINFYSYGFVEETDLLAEARDLAHGGANIFCNELEIYALKHIDEEYGDYRLKLEYPKGLIFKTKDQSNNIEAVADTLYQGVHMTDNFMFYWFQLDSRVTTASEGYHRYGGPGWKYLSKKGNKSLFSTTESENTAYENKYMCVGVYNETIILKTYFTIYNDNNNTNISITSDLGVKFSFDRGIPLLTCLVDDKAENFDSTKRDSWYEFQWSKVDIFGNTTPLDTTVKELEEEKAKVTGTDSFSIADILRIENQIALLEGVEFPKGKTGNQLKYPVKNIDTLAIFRCSVYTKDNENGNSYFIGSGELTLQNEGQASPNDYYILIENGDQVFQYSESGVSPSNERNAEPLPIYNLKCHFYDPAGLEVNENTYSVKWKIPQQSTLITTPSTGMTVNPANEIKEWYTGSKEFPMGRMSSDGSKYIGIKDNFDYQALNNQITCIVTYQNEQYMQDTRFSFVKVGDNGTNGTDVVAKIVPNAAGANKNILNTDMLAIEISSSNTAAWNTGDAITKGILTYKLYQRNEEINFNSIKWTISGASSSAISYNGSSSTTNKNPVITNTATATTAKYRNQIVQAYATVTGNATRYYCNYPIPIIKYSTATSTCKVHIDNTYTLKQILYNADGRNPLYNKNQGIKLNITGTSADSKTVFLEAVGGASSNQSTAAFKFTTEKDANSAKSVASWTGNPSNGEVMLYILPDDVYTGEYTNNLIHGTVKSGSTTQAEFWIPIHMQLNTYGLTSLNKWDGNHIEINDDGSQGYILAPQIGAGKKNSVDNTFTGIVMGTATTYDSTAETVGLLGYSSGKQSIFLDAETGNATFGLPEDQASRANKYTEGRIELRPGGDSKIGNWVIGSRSFYNMSGATPVSPDNTYTSYPKNAQILIPHNAGGILLNSDPSFVSIKTPPLTTSNSDIKFTDANTIIAQNDALELELDPNKTSVFSIYRHKYNSSTKKYTERTRLVGINANGQFFSNAVENGESSMGIGPIGAFGATAASGTYMGVQFAYSGHNIIKLFVPTSDATSSSTYPAGTRPLYISAGSTISNEYPRPLYMYGKSVNLYASDSSSTGTTSNWCIRATYQFAQLKANNSYLTLNDYINDSGAQVGSTLKTSGALTETIGASHSVNVSTSRSDTIGTTLTQKVGEGVTHYWRAGNTVRLGGNLSLYTSCAFNSSNNAIAVADDTDGTNSGFRITTTNGTTGSMMLGSRNGSSSTSIGTGSQTNATLSQAKTNMTSSAAYINLSKNGVSRLISSNGWSMQTNTGPITLATLHNASGITLIAYPAQSLNNTDSTIYGASGRLRLYSAVPTGKSSPIGHFSLQTADSSVISYDSANGPDMYNFNRTLLELAKVGSTYAGVSISPGVKTNYLKITGANSTTNTSYPYYGLESSRPIRATGGENYFTNSISIGGTGTLSTAGNITCNGSFLAPSDKKYGGTYYTKYDSNSGATLVSFSSNNINSNIAELWKAISGLRTYMQNWVDAKGYATQSWVTSNTRSNTWTPTWSQVRDKPGTFPPSSHTHDYVSNTRFNNHNHHTVGGSGTISALTDWDTYGSIVGDISHIKGTINLVGTYTGGPTNPSN